MANSNSEFSLEHEEDFDLSVQNDKLLHKLDMAIQNKEIAQKLGLVRVRFATI